MKQFFTLAVATMLSASMVAQVATFENEEGGINCAAESVWYGYDGEPEVEGDQEWTSGAYTFTTDAQPSQYYFSLFWVSSETANTSTGWDQPSRSAKGGAYEGNNFCVWNMDYYGDKAIRFDEQIVPGFYVNNNAYAINSMANGDSYAKKFDENDWFKLTCYGILNGDTVGRVVVDLAKDGWMMTEWTYVDLSTIGTINAMHFALTSSDASEWGMNTPAYFCMDNFGAAKETAVENNEVSTAATKMVIDGKVVILKNGQRFDMMGNQLL